MENYEQTRYSVVSRPSGPSPYPLETGSSQGKNLSAATSAHRSRFSSDFGSHLQPGPSSATSTSFHVEHTAKAVPVGSAAYAPQQGSAEYDTITPSTGNFRTHSIADNRHVPPDGHAHKRQKCLLCEMVDGALARRTEAFGVHNPSIFCFQPHPDDVRDATLRVHEHELEWTLWLFECRYCRRKYQIYRFHLLSCDIVDHELVATAHIKLQALASHLGRLFRKCLNNASQLLRINRDRQHERLPSQASSRNVHRHRRPAPHDQVYQQASHRDQRSPQVSFDALQQSDDPSVPPDFMQERHRQPSANTAMLDAYPYLQPAQAVGHSDVDPHPTASDYSSAPYAATSQFESSEVIPDQDQEAPSQGQQKRAKRKMNHEKYKITRSIGACAYSRRKHSRCICNDGGMTCDQSRRGQSQLTTAVPMPTTPLEASFQGQPADFDEYFDYEGASSQQDYGL